MVATGDGTRWGTQAPTSLGAGNWPRYTGFSGTERSTNAVPLVSPTIAYSFPDTGSVHPQTSFPLPPPIWGRVSRASMSTLLQG